MRIGVQLISLLIIKEIIFVSIEILKNPVSVKTLYCDYRNYILKENFFIYLEIIRISIVIHSVSNIHTHTKIMTNSQVRVII